MPDPVKAPPEALVSEEVTKATFEFGEMYEPIPIPFDRLKEQHNEALKQLAYLRAFLKYNNIEVK